MNILKTEQDDSYESASNSRSSEAHFPVLIHCPSVHHHIPLASDPTDHLHADHTPPHTHIHIHSSVSKQDYK